MLVFFPTAGVFVPASGPGRGGNVSVFDAGFFIKIRGIFKFCLLETKPDLKLFITPIGFDPRKPFFPVTHPPGYAAELAAKIGKLPVVKSAPVMIRVEDLC